MKEQENQDGNEMIRVTGRNYDLAHTKGRCAYGARRTNKQIPHDCTSFQSPVSLFVSFLYL